MLPRTSPSWSWISSDSGGGVRSSGSSPPIGEAGGDPGNDALLYFYASYRAWVRAKVTCLRAGELAERSSEREDEQHDAHLLFELGHRLAWKARLPFVIAVCGVAASGKTALASRLSAVSGLPAPEFRRRPQAARRPCANAARRPGALHRRVHAANLRGAWSQGGFGGRTARRCHRRRDLPPRRSTAGIHDGARGIVGTGAVRRVSGADGGSARAGKGEDGRHPRGLRRRRRHRRSAAVRLRATG